MSEYSTSERGKLSLRIVRLADELKIPRHIIIGYETAVNGEAVAVSCADLLVIASGLGSDSQDYAMAHRTVELCRLLTERLRCLGRQADEAYRRAYPDPFAEHPA